MINVLEAQEIIFKTTPKATIESITLSDSNGRVLAQDIVASRNQPPFHRVAMDGIAIDSSIKDTKLTIEAIQAAGSEQLKLKDQNNCIEVMTGASLPLGCDCVIPYENITIDQSNKTATITFEDIVLMKNIHKEASDYKEGDILLRAGTKITSPICAILASQGKSKISVFKLPKVVIISTGTELVELDEKIAPHKIYMSNSYAIESELKSYGLTQIQRLHITDDENQTEKQIKEAISKFDILILTGGVSKGKFDFIPDTLSKLGVKKHYHKIKQKPGKPMWYGTKEQKQVFALPGNPDSCLVCLRRYIIPALSTLLGEKNTPVYGQLQAQLTFKKQFTLFAPVRAEYSINGKLAFYPIKTNGSGDFYSSGDSTGFIELPANKEVFNPGDTFQYYSWF